MKIDKSDDITFGSTVYITSFPGDRKGVLTDCFAVIRAYDVESDVSRPGTALASVKLLQCSVGPITPKGVVRVETKGNNTFTQNTVPDLSFNENLKTIFLREYGVMEGKTPYYNSRRMFSSLSSAMAYIYHKWEDQRQTVDDDPIEAYNRAMKIL